jgi:hypothetical protein
MCGLILSLNSGMHPMFMLCSDEKLRAIIELSTKGKEMDNRTSL